jgi:hypothetical protein
MDMYLNSNDADLKKLTLSAGNTVNNCTFDLYAYKIGSSEVYVMSYATGNGGVAAVEYHLKGEGLAPYDNAIHTNSVISGHFQGSVNVAGSIYSRGTLDMGANIKIVNNYQTGHHPLVPGDTLYDILIQETDLDTKVRVKGGDLLFGSASTQVGYAGSGNTVAGIYVDGTSEAVPGVNAWSDEYTSEVPDLPMPSILDGLNDHHGASTISACIASEGYTGNDAAVAMSLYAAWATGTGCWSTSRGAVYDGNITIDKDTSSGWLVGPDGNGNGMEYTAPPGGVGLGTITIQGTVVVNGDFTFGDNKIDGLKYTASGANTGSGSDAAEGASLVVNGNFTADGQFYADQGYLKGALYPATNDINSLGVVVHGDVSFSGHNDDTITGFFFSDGQVNFNKQAKFAGTVIGDLVNYAQVPDVYQVPRLKLYMPPAIPGGTGTFKLTQREWRRVY